MKWIKNVMRIYDDGIVGSCPYCGSDETDYMFVEHEGNTKERLL